MDNFKRIAVREAFYLLLNGMHEMASKTDVLSSFGKYIVDELDVTPVKDGDERQPYKGKYNINNHNSIHVQREKTCNKDCSIFIIVDT